MILESLTANWLDDDGLCKFGTFNFKTEQPRNLYYELEAAAGLFCSDFQS